ncbi:hypothetical protein [Halostella pelagica]|uniref:hypothetical protein n=1 Tax=Halostella pelagica TaxID=2583824 RepID=UPI00108167FA|nr:hypothetical protein [Halostella pelagica]
MTADGIERPEPFLWLGRHEELDEPIWFLPLESEEDSAVWDDDELEIRIISWSVDTEADRDGGESQ